jgi:methylase of polypeptide subunit release factors
MTGLGSEAFAAQLRHAEDRLRAVGLSGRAAYAALCRNLAQRLDLSEHLWLEGPDAPEEADLDRIPMTSELDLFGLAYERFFPEIFKAERGQYFTPRPLVELMADLVGVRPGQRVLDPTCGSGTFMVVALSRGAEVDGIEIDPELVALCRLNLALHGADPRCVVQGDLFRAEVEQSWDVILANPPFSVDIRDPATLDRFELAAGRNRMGSDTLFMEAAHARLRPGGQMAVVLPRSILANPSYQFLRDWIGAHFVRRAVVSLPEGVFRPFGGTTTRAVVLVLQKLPARVQPWVASVVESPGYDPTRKVYRPTEPDELAGLRIALKQGTAPLAPAGSPAWLPEQALRTTSLGEGVCSTGLLDLAPLAPSQHIRPSDEPERSYAEVDLADVDKHTGEVSRGRVRAGAEFRGSKTGFEPGDLLFARIRPSLNNVVIVSRPQAELPDAMCGSSEWVRLAPPGHPYFALVAARSVFVREQLRSTGGQTRPRIKSADLTEVQVPDPGPESRALIDALVSEAHQARLDARRRMDAVAALYERFGRGELDQAALLQALRAL